VHGTFGGIAVCFRKSLHVQPLEINVADHLELMLSFSVSATDPSGKALNHLFIFKLTWTIFYTHTLAITLKY